MANYVLTQTGQEVQDILDSMGATYFFSQTATFASDNTYADYPYKGTISLNGVDGTMGVEVSFSNDQAISGNYSPICNTTNNAVEIWSKVNTSITIPTIKIYKNGYVNLNGSSNYMPQSGGNFTGAISVNNSPVMTKDTQMSGTAIASGNISYSASTGVTMNSIAVTQMGKMLLVDVNFNVTSAISHNGSIFTLNGFGTPLSSGVPNSVVSVGGASSTTAIIRPTTSGSSILFTCNGATPVANYYKGVLTVILA